MVLGIIKIVISIILSFALFFADFGVGMISNRVKTSVESDSESENESGENNKGFFSKIADKVSDDITSETEGSINIDALLALDNDDQRETFIYDFCSDELKVTKQEVAVITEQDIVDGVKNKCTDPSYFEARDWKNGTVIDKYTGNDEYVIIPNSIDGKNVLSVESYAFKDNTNIKMCVLPEGCGCIETSAFEGCRRLSKIVLSSFLMQIEVTAFKDCDSLEGVELLPVTEKASEPAFLFRKVGMSAFQNCVSMSYCNLDNEQGIRNVFDTAIVDGIGGISKLERVVLPYGTSTTIRNSAFENDDNLREVVNSEGITKIEFRSFFACSSLGSMPLPVLSELQDAAFQNCTSIKTFVVSDALNGISSDAFSGCSELSMVLFDEEGIGENGKCDNYLKLYTDANAVTGEFNIDSVSDKYNRWDFSNLFVKGSDDARISSRAFDATALTSVVVPSRFFRVDDAFNRCENLTSFTWKATEYNKEDQKMWAYFNGGNLKELNLSKSVAEASIKNVYISNPECIVRVPAGSIAEQICINDEVPYEIVSE